MKLQRTLVSLALAASLAACASTASSGSLDLADRTPLGMHDPRDADMPTPSGDVLQLRWRPKTTESYEQSLWRLDEDGEPAQMLVDWGDWSTIKSTDGAHFFGRDFERDWYRIEADGGRTAMDDWAALKWCQDDEGQWCWFAVHNQRDEISRITPEGTAIEVVPASDFEYSDNNWLTTMDPEQLGDERTWVVRNLDLEPLLVDAHVVPSVRYEARDSSQPTPYLGQVPGGGLAFYRFPHDRVPGPTFASAERLGLPFDSDSPFAWLLREQPGGPGSLWAPQLEAPFVEGVLSVGYGLSELGGAARSYYECKLAGGEVALVTLKQGRLFVLARGSDSSTFEDQAVANLAAFDAVELGRRAPSFLGLDDGEALDEDFDVRELHESFARLASGKYVLGVRGGEVQLAVRGASGQARYLGSGYSAIGPVTTQLPALRQEAGSDANLVAWQVQSAATGEWSVRSLDLDVELASPDVVTSFAAKVIACVGAPRVQYDTSESARVFGRVYDFDTSSAPSRFLDDGRYLQVEAMLEPGEYGPEVTGWFAQTADGWRQELSRDMDHVFHEGFDLSVAWHTDQHGRELEAWTWGERDGTWRLSLLPDYRGASQEELLANMPGLLYQAGELREAQYQDTQARLAQAREEALARAQEDYARFGCPDCGGTGYELAGWVPADNDLGRIYVLQGKWVIRHIGGPWGNDHVVFEPKVCEVCNGAGLGTEPVPYREPTPYE